MTRHFVRLCALLLAFLALLPPALGQADTSERILSFHSDITIHANATLSVTETLKVRAANAQIRHGIYRDFPTTYTDRLGNRYQVGFTLLGATRDDAGETTRVEPYANGLRIYLGDPDVLVEPGLHTYTLQYEATRELGFFPDHDELYWNVTGNGWVFPIDEASATITLPPGIPASKLHVEGYTGAAGARGQDYRASVTADAQAHFVTTRPLRSYEGLTVVVTFPKGFVTAPTALTRIGYLLHDNQFILLAALGLLVVLGYFLLAWRNVGRDLPAGTIIPRYTPPAGYSPAAIRYIRKMAYDNKAFATAIIDLAVKGYIMIEEDKPGFFGARMYYLRKLRDLPIDPRARLQEELGRGAVVSFADLATRADITVDTAKSLVQQLIAEGLPIDVSGEMVRLYSAAGHTSPPPASEPSGDERVLLQTLLPQPNDFLMLRNEEHAQIMTAITKFQAELKSAYQDRMFVTNTYAFGIGLLLSGLAILMLMVAMARTGSEGGSPIAIIVLGVLCAGINALFYYLLKAPTPSGRKLLDEIAGFRMYLETAEKDRLNLDNPPEKTPQLFEQYLPYALALDVEQAWCERFAGVLAQATMADGQPYHPGWYAGGSWRAMNTAAFASSLGGAFTSAISSSSTPPGSSSGSGGGGSSGGGGGGGGGGGW
ncbi:MAG TPA: DUF2207 domain-containing protein [Armatimonadota bacterium]|jgi:uncharacterized membrane protein YgcG